jgi:hypothetical protein
MRQELIEQAFEEYRTGDSDALMPLTKQESSYVVGALDDKWDDTYDSLGAEGSAARLTRRRRTRESIMRVAMSREGLL